ncbi:acyl-CoA-binding protein [Streptantibioticus ferralitis]|uniref:Acyl-CoA-binding protein n=1 Tax=Streptantibioticus ferralitis TaxID=236510 RepID=A0ABT5Z881_9ACTN|nr:acyl-CoA-binding protein [Streptantibioticus ferralitis]MDF2259756.1 acyl-CoA-binding protein [Streptantibioticus ferralitis]
MSDSTSTGNQAFVTASQEVVKLSKAPSNDIKLKLYAYFKQGIKGDNDTPEPGFIDFTGKAKWKAWTEVKGMSKEEAQKKYIELVEELKAADA